MQEETNFHSTENNQIPSTELPNVSNGHKVIQPSPALIQELQARQQQPQSPTTVATEISHQVQPIQSSHSQPIPSDDDQLQFGVSASQMGWSQSSSKNDFDIKKLVTKTVIGLAVIGGVFAVLVSTNIIALSQFKTLSYINSSGTHYSLTFYTKHATKTLKSGITELVSKVSEGGKFPLTLAIDSGPITGLEKNGIKECNGPLPKAFDVQNNNINKKLSVCSFSTTNGGPVVVYVVGFSSNNQANIVTISQDLSGVDLSSPSGAQKSLTKSGLEVYQDDITKIVASIKVVQ